MTLTPQGRKYFNQCQEPVSVIQEAERVLTQEQREPEGTLRLSVPMILSQESFLDFLSRFSKQHARIRIDLFITNLFLDLVADNIDLAIRFGELRDSSVVATKVGKCVRYVVASREYMKGRKLPSEPQELKSHDCVMLNANNHEADWELVNGRKKLHVHVSGPMTSRDCKSVTGLVFRGHGIGLLPSTYCEEALARCELVRLLPRWTSPPTPVFAVYPSRKFVPSRVNAFLQALAAWKNPLWVRE
jgi:DNA-binding transcriptional LysR family regulator